MSLLSFFKFYQFLTRSDLVREGIDLVFGEYQHMLNQTRKKHNSNRFKVVAVTVAVTTVVREDRVVGFTHQ